MAMEMLILLLLPLSLFLIFYIGRKGSNYLKNLPPGSEGWPVVGETSALAALGIQQLVRDRMQKHSPQVFKTALYGEKLAVLCGAEGNRFVFTNETKLVKPWFPLSLRKTMFPELDGATSMEPKAHFLSFKAEALKLDALKPYIPVMDSLAREHLDHGWRRDPVVKVVPSTKKYTFELACRLFMNVVDPHQDWVAKMLEPFTLFTNGLVCLPINLPGTVFNRALKGSRLVRDEVMKIVAERRRELMTTTTMMAGEGPQDLLTKMLAATDEDGKYMSESQVCNVMIGLLVAGQYEVSSALTIVIHYLSQLPHIYQHVFQEQMEIAKSKGPDEPLTWEDVEKMKYTWNVVRESMRLTPPALGSFREATAEITYAGFTIPKGWKMMWTSHSTHKDPDNFPEPEKFDPSRFEGAGPAPYTFVAFGRGPRMCPGRGYTKLTMLVFIHNLVTRFKLEKVIPNEKMLFHRMSPTPAHAWPSSSPSSPSKLVSKLISFIIHTIYAIVCIVSFPIIPHKLVNQVSSNTHIYAYVL